MKRSLDVSNFGSLIRVYSAELDPYVDLTFSTGIKVLIPKELISKFELEFELPLDSGDG